ncbi:MAG: 2-aminoethylphosphonate aminotransferase [bacterium]
MERYILLNPGPVNLSERVRQALLRPDLCHREQEFKDLQNGIRRKLLEVYELDGEQWAAVLLTGSGTAAVEAMVTSLVPEQGHVLILENGVYGERMARIAELYGISYTALHHDWGEVIDLGRLKASLDQHPVSHVAVVHHETTTGRLNDLQAVADCCASRDVSLLVDGVSSFGAEAIHFADWNLAACAATANKCLHGVPGTSFVVLRRRALEHAKTARNLYLDLRTYLKHQDDSSTPFTQSAQIFYALNEALDELRDEGGWQQRRKSYRLKMDIVSEGLTGLEIAPLFPSQECSCVLNAFHLPRGVTYDALHDGLKEQGFVIYAGQGELAKTIFRISAMGATTADDLHRLIRKIAQLVTE